MNKNGIFFRGTCKDTICIYICYLMSGLETPESILMIDNFDETW